MGQVLTLVRVEVDAEGFPVLPRWAARAAGLRGDQRRLVDAARGPEPGHDVARLLRCSL